jgi:riboflavin synthase
MFTGIITALGTIIAITDRPDLRRIRIAAPFDTNSLTIGASIACQGPCLTVIDKGDEGEEAWFEVELAQETLRLTNGGAWYVGQRLNLERSLKIGDELGGHIVTGHIDGLCTILEREDTPEDAGSRFVLRAPDALSRFIAPKGSVALDGTSLTVNLVTKAVFAVLLIPHTLAVTTWQERRPGDTVHLEVDLMARYVARLYETSLAKYTGY